jgi:hypothetical protein
VTIAELAHGIERADTIARRTTREQFLRELLNEFSVKPITVPVAFRAGKLDGSLQAKGIRTLVGLGLKILTTEAAWEAAAGRGPAPRKLRLLPRAGKWQRPARVSEVDSSPAAGPGRLASARQPGTSCRHYG